ANDLVGETYRHVLAETAAIVGHQWRNDITHSALKGFLFHGGVGIGKTTMARRLAYELMREFGESDEHDDVVMVIIDGADIARGRYGDSEEQLRKLSWACVLYCHASGPIRVSRRTRSEN